MPAVPVAAISTNGTATYHPVDASRSSCSAMVHDPGALHSVVGRWWEIAVGRGPVDPNPRAGYGFDLSPDATRLASAGFFELAVRDLDGEFVARIDLIDDPESRDAYGAMWVDHHRLAVVELAQPGSGNEFRLVVTDAELGGYPDARGTVIGTDLDAPWPQLAGVTEIGEILVLAGRRSDGTARHLFAYDPDTLQHRPHADVRLPRPATAAWVDGPHLMWIDRQSRLFVDGDRLPGRYALARTP